MTKIHNIIVAFLLFFGYLYLPLFSQVLNVPQVIQEQNEWCWAASSACMLGYFNDPTAQCTIAEYTRSVSTSCNPNNYGTVNCCTDPTQGCNQWNYNWGCPGSIQDILTHFGFILTNSISDSLNLTAIQTEISGGRPFIFRWGWTTGGGQFLVGYGISGNNMYYNDPWFGEGYEINTYHWVQSGTNSEGTHTWTHTQTLANVGIENSSLQKETNFFPNPTCNNLTFEVLQPATIEILDIQGQLIKKIEVRGNNETIDVSAFSNGMYLSKIITEKGIEVKKFVKE
jgi:hypothetical protein